MRSLRIAVGEVVIRPERAATLAAWERIIRAAAVMQVEILCFGETALTGFDYDLTKGIVQAMAEPADGPILSTGASLAAELGLILGVGFWERDGAAHYNSYALLHPDGARQIVRKRNLIDVEYAAGVKPGPLAGRSLAVKGIRLGVALCADIGAAEIRRHLAAERIELLLLPTGGGMIEPPPLTEAELETPEGLARYRDERLGLWQRDPEVRHADWPCTAFAAMNSLGPEGARSYHWGQSQIVDGHGLLRAQIPGSTVAAHWEDRFTHATLRFPPLPPRAPA